MNLTASWSPKDHVFHKPCYSRVICSKSHKIDSSVFFIMTDQISELPDPAVTDPGAVLEVAF